MKYAQSTFVSADSTKYDHRLLIKAVEKNDSVLKTLLTDVDTVTGVAKQLTTELKIKASQQDVKAVRDQLDRFALYDDYKDLYGRVVPPVAKIQEDYVEMSAQIKQFQQIIAQFDQNLQLRALKTEFSDLLIKLRAYTKEKTFKRTV